MKSEEADRRVLKIAIVVHGRFDAFELVNALIGRGHDVRLFTNYPKWAVKRFGISEKNVTSFWQHGVLERILRKSTSLKAAYPEAFLHRLFGRWASRALSKCDWDAIHVFSGVAEEIFSLYRQQRPVKILMRASAHIKKQAVLLKEEQRRIGCHVSGPSDWMIAREMREYGLSGYIRITSEFVRQSFIENKIDAEKLWLIPSAIPFEQFHPPEDVISSRISRILSDKPLRVVYIGTMQHRKGLLDLLSMVKGLSGKSYEFCLVGPVQPEALEVLAEIKAYAKVVSKQPQSQLPKWYAWADIYIFPTIEDGFPQTLAQAFANAIPMIATPNSSAPDFIEEDKSGWIVPVRRPDLLIERLQWCNSNRQELAAMVQYIYKKGMCSRTWDDTARELEQKVCEVLNLKGKVGCA